MEVFLSIPSHKHQNNHREAIMSYGFKLSPVSIALPNRVRI